MRGVYWGLFRGILGVQTMAHRLQGLGLTSTRLPAREPLRRDAKCYAGPGLRV